LPLPEANGLILWQYHTADDAAIYGPGDMTDTIVRFTATLDPNGALSVLWPAYTPGAPSMFHFVDGDVPFEVINDTYRAEGIGALVGPQTRAVRSP
jgi:hypothetical protein